MIKRPSHRPRNLSAWRDFYELCRSVEGPHGFTIALLRQVIDRNPRELSTKVRQGVALGYLVVISPGFYKLGIAPQEIGPSESDTPSESDAGTSP